MANLDADMRNADWTKARSEGPLIPGVESLEDLIEVIEVSGLTVEEFKRLPIYQENVEDSELLQKL